MNNTVLELISSCEWSPVYFLIFSENVFAPLIYYSHLGVLIVALFFGFFVFLNNKKGLLNQLILYLCLSIGAWMFSDLVLWATDQPKYTMFFWSLEIIFEPLIYIFALRFFYVFVSDGQDVSLKNKIFIYSLILPTLVLVSTNFGLTGYDLTNCDRAAVEGLLPKYGYLIEIIMVLMIVFLAFDRFYKTNVLSQKKQIFFTASSICLFLLSFSLGNIAEVITENWYIGQIGYIGIPIFMAFLSYQIVQFKTFRIKLIGSQVLVASIWFLIFSLLFIRTIENSRIVVAATLALFSILAMLLVRSVKREVEQRERIEKLAKELEWANEKLRELDQMKSEFLSLATHQIRSPLTAIKGYSSMLLEGDFGVLPEKAKEAANIVLISSQNLINIVGDFLDISRIEQGRMVYNKSIFEVTDLLLEVTNSIKPNIVSAGLTIDLDIGNNDSARINADRDKIKQVIGNIIDNAVKYTVKGGIVVSIKLSGGKVLILIKDTGVGIDPAEMGKLFNKFSRTKDANKTNVIGTGLGLYIAKKMIEAHNGDIKVASEGLGKGTTFTIELPRYK